MMLGGGGGISNEHTNTKDNVHVNTNTTRENPRCDIIFPPTVYTCQGIMTIPYIPAHGVHAMCLKVVRKVSFRKH